MFISKHKMAVLLLVVVFVVVGCGEKDNPSESPEPSALILGGHDWDDFEPEIGMKRALKERVTRWLSGDMREGELYQPPKEEADSVNAFCYEEAVAAVPKGTIVYDENIIGGWKQASWRKFTLHASITAEDGSVLKKYVVTVYDRSEVGIQLCDFKEE